MWGISELVAMATDLAEFLGAALGFYLLFHIPLIVAALLAGVVTLLILALERRGFPPPGAGGNVVRGGRPGLLAHANNPRPTQTDPGVGGARGAPVFRGVREGPSHPG